MVFQAALMAIIVLDGLAFIAFCTAIYLRKTCTPRRQKDVRWALRIAYVCMFVLGVICVATIGASPAAAAIAGVLLGNAAALMVADFLVPRCFTLDTHSIGADTRFKSLEFGTDKKRSGLSYTGLYEHAPAELSPYAFFERVFGGSFSLPGEDSEPDPRLALDRSVLDAVMEDIASLNMQVGASDKIRLEQHLDGIRAIEKQIAILEDPPQLAACAYPPTPQAEYGEDGGLQPFHEMNAIFSQIAAYALACDQTRVISSWFTSAVANGTLFPGQDDSHHSLTHFEADPQPHVHECMLFCMEAFRDLLSALDGIQEGDGTLLDHMIVLGTSDCGSGKFHSGEDFPTVMVGSGDGALVTDIHWRSDAGDNATRVPLTIARALGIDMPSFGVGEHAASLSISEILT